MSLPRTRPLLVLALAALAGCGAEPPQWVELARRTPAVLAGDGAQSWHGLVLAADADRGVWISRELAPADWRDEGITGVQSFELRVESSVGRSRDGLAYRLELGDREFRQLPPSELFKSTAEGFHVFGGRLYCRSLGALPSEGRAQFSTYVHCGELVDGAWRVSLGSHTGNGWLLWPQRPVEIELGAARQRSLSFALARQGALAQPGALARVRVHQDGRQIFERDITTLASDRLAFVRVDLADASASRLSFSVESQGMLVAVLAPVVGPRSPAPAARDARGDVVLFLADTFRADNLAALGGDGSTTPFLDELCPRALVFEHAWSPSTWTLPSHASLFSGLYPHEHGATQALAKLNASVATLAESFARAGYRTVAVTDRVFVSARHGLDQGFELFDEAAGSLQHTLARVRDALAGGDGRPLFLFVQSYEAHIPYGRSPIDGSATAWEHLHARILEQLGYWNPQTQPMSPELRELAQHALELYRQGARNLDAAVRTLHGELRERGMLEHGLFVFTSDHGEAFGEHNDFFHGGELFEESIHVPLLLAGARIEPARRAEPVSLVSLARTLVEWAGIEAPAVWRGPSLLAPASGSEPFAFGCYTSRTDWEVAARQGGHKIVLPALPEELRALRLVAAHDLEADPAEREDQTEAAWAAALARALQAPLEQSLCPRASPLAPSMDEDALEKLRALGYLSR